MKYTFRVVYSDGSTLEQPTDDSSRLLPGLKTASFDHRQNLRTKQVRFFSLHDGSREVACVDHATGSFRAAGQIVSPEQPLPVGFEWVEGDGAQGHYYRTMSVTLNPQTGIIGKPVTSHFVIGIQSQRGIKNYLAVV
jgi:hypothetical protein